MCFFSNEVKGSIRLEEFQDANPNGNLTAKRVQTDLGMRITALTGIIGGRSCVVCVESGTNFEMTIPNRMAELMGLMPDQKVDPVTYEVLLAERAEDDDWRLPDRILIKMYEDVYIEVDFDQRFDGAKFSPTNKPVDYYVDEIPTIDHNVWQEAYAVNVPRVLGRNR